VRASSKIEDKLTRGDVGAPCQGYLSEDKTPRGCPRASSPCR
jgi:hypothetical protein